MTLKFEEARPLMTPGILHWRLPREKKLNSRSGLLSAMGQRILDVVERGDDKTFEVLTRQNPRVNFMALHETGSGRSILTLSQQWPKIYRHIECKLRNATTWSVIRGSINSGNKDLSLCREGMKIALFQKNEAAFKTFTNFPYADSFLASGPDNFKMSEDAMKLGTRLRDGKANKNEIYNALLNAASLGRGWLFEPILRCIPFRERAAFISSKSFEILTEIVKNGELEPLLAFLQLLSKNIHTAFLTETQKGYSLLHCAAHDLDTTPEFVSAFLNLLPLNKASALVKVRDKDGDTALHVGALNNPRVAATILEYVPLNERPEFIRQKNNNNETALHKAAVGWGTEEDNWKLVITLIKSLPVEERRVFIATSDSSGRSSLDWAKLPVQVWGGVDKIGAMLQDILNDPRLRRELLNDLQ